MSAETSGDAVERISLLSLPHRQARALATSGVPVTICVNPVEYHGPHLSLHNDRVVSLGIVRRLAGRLDRSGLGGPFVLAGDIEAGVDPVTGPGTRHVAFADVRRAVLEACRAVAELGARRVVLMTFHGSPMHNHAIQAGVDWLARNGIPAIAPLVLALEAMVLADTAGFEPAFAGIVDQHERAEMFRTLPDDFHAGFFETSVALAVAHQHVSPDHTALPPCPPTRPPRALLTLSRLLAAAGHRRLAGELRVMAGGLGWMALRPFPGYTGRPHRASALAGEVFVSAMIERVADLAKRVFLEGAAPPRPPFAWMSALTLGGAVATPRVPLAAVALDPGA